ncbi:MAG TPA: 50S ribosomal protein L18 [bacterium]|nr:50S ribosomal protein L18 [bacterium]HNZ51263.1 50S ribosomal protein L18 [bacterium]HOF79746.1 50S ribosomal protein L18 [bacterium]HOH85158.1 50S ribosomal protein L18 [bacterium]HOQ91574.1 50S ribosomal protein L18 [bacterium]
MSSTSKTAKKIRRHNRVRAKISGTADCPRLSVFRSNRGMYLQAIDDTKGLTLASAHSREVKVKGNKTEVSQALGVLMAEKLLAKKISKIVFDRGSSAYHGRVQAAAEGARQAGLQF